MRCRHCRSNIVQDGRDRWVHKVKVPPYGFNYYYYCFLENNTTPPLKHMATPEEPEDLPLENV